MVAEVPAGVRGAGDDDAARSAARGAPPSGDPRTARTDRKIVAGALRLLREGGPQRVTIEAVSARTGVAKTSIYRRYDNSAKMLEAALRQTAAAEVPVVEDATWQEALDDALDLLLRDMGMGVAITLLQEPHSETSRVLRASVVRPRMDALRALLERDRSRGLIREAVDLDMVVDFVLGAAYAHVARYGSLDDSWTQRVHRSVTDLICTRPGAD
ncbi:hypothetical protein KVA01_05870 [Kocuria varians]|uniref:HTH tetR-type domain-containing protein n=1 Tax=Kocuria varians TaxID=1272 RepID=A0A4Y4D245_KOCVA|nr:TetR/AcrR family transcriptional regulator [Kocuria varians]GEC98432.1 hypothetical protein KVA01_05870 [Kocuria varians]